MKITHNKVGQNLNLVDGLKQDKLDGTKAAKDALSTSGGLSTLGAEATNVQLSDRAQEAKRIKELATAAPDVDMAKVEKFRALIDAGKYKVDARAIADRMVDEHLETTN
ncbi:MAG: flagellar biosynthesis anti-sigma factor FlgM [Bdellovibrionaceae bacterium]|nr:flagellar biosynthesis anti-sigma factor FlgM [Pseudobdellovibrionaceae bacterium]